MHLVKPLASLSTPAPRLLDGETYLRSLVARKNSLQVETFVLFKGRLWNGNSPEDEEYFLPVHSAADLICHLGEYDHMEWKLSSPSPITSISISPRTAHFQGRLAPRLIMQFAWQDDENEGRKMEISHFEQILDKHAEWS